ncbi:MAG: hypothetical protein ACLRTQ_02860 [Candidatus Borkfalkia sp.]
MPKDKSDERNVVMEIPRRRRRRRGEPVRGGTVPHHQHYAESMRWKLDIIDMQAIRNSAA